MCKTSPSEELRTNRNTHCECRNPQLFVLYWEAGRTFCRMEWKSRREKKKGSEAVSWRGKKKKKKLIWTAWLNKGNKSLMEHCCVSSVISPVHMEKQRSGWENTNTGACDHPMSLFSFRSSPLLTHTWTAIKKNNIFFIYECFKSNTFCSTVY